MKNAVRMTNAAHTVQLNMSDPFELESSVLLFIIRLKLHSAFSILLFCYKYSC